MMDEPVLDDGFATIFAYVDHPSKISVRGTGSYGGRFYVTAWQNVTVIDRGISPWLPRNWIVV